MSDTSDEAIDRQLRDAQAAVREIPAIRNRRQQAVRAAREAGWSKYKIAEVLGVKAPTVDSIIEALERQEAQR